MKTSQFKDYSDLPLFLNAETVAKTLGVAPSSAYELLHESDFPVLKIGNRWLYPKRNSSSGWSSTPKEAHSDPKLFHHTQRNFFARTLSR